MTDGLPPDGPAARVARLCGQDGYKTTLMAEDFLADDVLIADTLFGDPLTVEHGAPLRIVAPGHYGYKNLKHLSRIEFFTDPPDDKRGLRRVLDHPRARVAHEERGRIFPGWLLRRLFRPMIPRNVRLFANAMERFRS